MSVKFSASFEKKLDSKKILDAAERATQTLTIELTDKCKAKSPYKTGYLQGRHYWHSHPTSATSFSGEVVNRAHYWSFVEFGTSKMDARHWIYESMKEVRPVPTFMKYMGKYYKS